MGSEIMSEQESHPETECCNYICPITLPYPVMWNEFNKVVQCHNCGHVWEPKPATIAGIELKAGDIVKFDDGLVAEVAKDNDLVTDMGSPHWGSVWLVGHYPPRFTHKGGLQVISNHRPNALLSQHKEAAWNEKRVIQNLLGLAEGDDLVQEIRRIIGE